MTSSQILISLLSPKFSLDQACQTQITSRAAKATKTVKGAAKMKKSPKRATFYKNKLLEMSLFMFYNIFST